jgi:peptidoglycan pentaglycine glycine transferase (the first glycine)
MHEFVGITGENLGQYQQFVAQHGSFPQSYAWGEFQATVYEKVLRYGIVENGKFFITIQMFQSGAAGRHYFYAPYGPVVAGEKNAANFFDELAAGIRARHPKTIFLRTEPRFPATWGRASANISPHQTLVLDLTKPQDQLLSEMHQKTRYNIHVAEKHGVEVCIENSVSTAAAELLHESSRRAGIRGHSTSYYANLAEKLSGTEISPSVYCAYHEDDLVAANVVLRFGNTAVYLFGGSSSQKRNVMAPYLLQWRAIQDAQTQGAKIYDFWGVETDLNHAWAGFSKFKLGFGGEIKTYAGTRDSIFRSAWYNAYTIARKIMKKLRT